MRAAETFHPVPFLSQSRRRAEARDRLGVRTHHHPGDDAIRHLVIFIVIRYSDPSTILAHALGHASPDSFRHPCPYADARVQHATKATDVSAHRHHDADVDVPVA